MFINAFTNKPTKKQLQNKLYLSRKIHNNPLMSLLLFVFLMWLPSCCKENDTDTALKLNITDVESIDVMPLGLYIHPRANTIDDLDGQRPNIKLREYEFDKIILMNALNRTKFYKQDPKNFRTVCWHILNVSENGNDTILRIGVSIGFDEILYKGIPFAKSNDDAEDEMEFEKSMFHIIKYRQWLISFLFNQWWDETTPLPLLDNSEDADWSGESYQLLIESFERAWITRFNEAELKKRKERKGKWISSSNLTRKIKQKTPLSTWESGFM